MARNKRKEDLSVEELRRLMIEKRRAERKKHLEHYRKTGRVVSVENDPRPLPIDSMASQRVVMEEDQAATSKPRKRWIDSLLFLIEIAAVAGLVFILFSGFSMMRNLNQEVADVLEQPTLTPTPLIMAVVLPSGHTPPNSPGGVSYNEQEIPEHLRPMVQSLANVPLPTQGPQQAVRVQIPAISVDAPVVQGDGWEQLKKGVGQYIGSPNPGEDGNIVLSAHNDVFGEIFRDLDHLQTGDEVVLFTSQKTYTYVIDGTRIVEPTQVEVLSPTENATLTLISCYPYMVDNQRIVVTAYLKE